MEDSSIFQKIRELLNQGKSYREIQSSLHVSSKTIAKTRKLSKESEGMKKSAEELGKQVAEELGNQNGQVAEVLRKQVEAKGDVIEQAKSKEESEDWDIIISPPGPKDDKFAWSIAPLVCLIKCLDYLLPEGLMVKVVGDDKLKLITAEYLKNSIFNLIALARQVEMYNRYGLVPSLMDAMNWTQELLDKMSLRPSKLG
jgi:hypothetical protein